MVAFLSFNIPKRSTIPVEGFFPSSTSGLANPFYLYIIISFGVFMVILYALCTVAI